MMRVRPTERKAFGIRIEDPAVDFAGLARAFGVYGLGPVTDPEQLSAALREAAAYVRREWLPALVDVSPKTARRPRGNEKGRIARCQSCG